MSENYTNILIPKLLFNNIKKFCDINDIEDYNEYISKLISSEFTKDKFGELGIKTNETSDEISNLLFLINNNLEKVTTILKNNVVTKLINEENISEDNDVKSEEVIEFKEKNITNTDYDNIKLITKKSTRKLK